MSVRSTVVVVVVLAYLSCVWASSLAWSGYAWTQRDTHGVKSGPGPNYFCAANAYVESGTEGDLVMSVAPDPSDPTSRPYCCSEVYLSNALGYGTYSFGVNGAVEEFTDVDRNIVLGLFLYKNDTLEIDIEFARWGAVSPSANNADYVNQPGGTGQIEMWKMTRGVANSTHEFTWTSNKISWVATDDSTGTTVHSWSSSVPPIPQSSDELVVHINFWMMSGLTPAQKTTYAKLSRFSFTPL
ncbi:glycoside hydrolase family 16 protein [Pelomyxa schiedti]|nr:glycoside hydrolase family 16 protein [Pelomyxa schiedti]